MSIFPQTQKIFSYQTKTGKYVRFDISFSWLLLVVSAELLVYVYATLFDNENFQQSVLAVILLSISLYPMWRYLRAPVDLPLVPFVSIIYGVYYGLPVLLPYEPYIRFEGYSALESIYALQLSIIGLVAMLLTFYLCPVESWEKWVPRMPRTQWSDVKAQRAALVFGIIGFGTRLVLSTAAVPQQIQQFYILVLQFSLLSIAMLFYLQLQKKLPKFHSLLLWVVLIPLQLALDISSGFLYGFFKDLLLLLMIYLVIRKRMPWMAICVFGIVGFALMLAKKDFRAETWGNDKAKTALSNTGLYIDLILDTPSSISDSDSLDHKIKVAVNRFDVHAIFAHVISYTPRSVSFWNGESYTPLFTRLIPRFVWPDKPTEEMGQLFGHRYGILDTHDTTTSMNTPQMVEFYMNFGLTGLMLGMALIGIIYRLLQHVFKFDQNRQWSIVAGAVVYSSLLNVESNFSLVFGNLFIWSILLGLLGRYLFGSARPLNAPQPLKNQLKMIRVASRGAK